MQTTALRRGVLAALTAGALATGLTGPALAHGDDDWDRDRQAVVPGDDRDGDDRDGDDRDGDDRDDDDRDDDDRDDDDRDDDDRGKGRRGDRPDFTLTVLFGNDGESALLPIERDGAQVAGAALMESTMQRERRRGERGGYPYRGKRGVLAVSGGDNFLPSAQLSASRQTEGHTIYDAVAFNALDYDASIFGNHDFDLGPPFLADFLGQVEDTTFSSANLDFTGEPGLQAFVDDGLIVRAHVVKERGERIGVIGLTTPDLPELTSLGEVEVDPALAEIANATARAFERSGVDKVVLVSHLQDIDNELALVPDLQGIDVVVGAGGGEVMADADHRLLPEDSRSVDPAAVPYEYPEVRTAADGARVPVVTTSGLYRYVGRLVVTFDRDGEVLSYDERKSRPVPVTSVGPDAVRPDRGVLREVQRPVEDFVEELAQTVVATTEVPLDGVRASIRGEETNLGNLVADALLASGRAGAAAAGVEAPVVAIQNGGGIRNDSVIPPGDLTALDVNGIVPFTNFVSVAPALPIEDFVAAVEHAASTVDAGSFAQIAGFTYTASADGSVQSLVLDDGTVVVEDGALAADAPATISLASIDFLLRGNDGYDSLGGAAFTVLPQLQEEALVTFLTEDLGGVVTAADYPAGGEGRSTIG